MSSAGGLAWPEVLNQHLAAQWSAEPAVLLALHFGPLLAEAHRNFNSFRGGPRADFALQNEPLLHYEDFFQHRDDGDTILRSDPGRGAAHSFQPIIEQGEKPFAMLQNLWIKHRDWVFEPIEYSSVDRLVETMDADIIGPAETRFDELVMRRAEILKVRRV